MKTKDLCSPCTTALQCLEAGGCALSKEKHQPSRRQIIFNWLMDEDGWQTKKDGYWGGSEEVAKVDELLAVLDALPSARAAIIEECAIAAWSAGMESHNKALGLPTDAREVGSAAARAIRALASRRAEDERAAMESRSEREGK